MAQTEIVQTKIKLCKATNSRTPVEVGDTVTFILWTDDNSYATKDVTLTYADEDKREYGWDREVTDVRSLDIKRAHNKHTPQCS
jgi:predicted RNA-binding protein (virulence factor B family)